ncbi:MAG: hypothetical protein K8R39_10785 [Arcobacteraceae bacterium]|nr:hypothetical protein [Arcobacteraceae bacterium]
MYLLESEIIEYINNQHGMEVINADALYNPLKSINIKRDSNLKIILETTSPLNSKTEAVTIPAGTVYVNKNEVILKDKFSKRLFILSGVTPYASTLSVTNKLRTELSYLDSIKSTLESLLEEKYLIEFVSNMDIKNFILSDKILINKSTTERISIDKINFSDTSNSELNSWGCISNKIDDFSLYICSYTHNNQNYQYILYNKLLLEEERRKIRNCISFILGKPILYLGYSTYTEDSKMVSFELRSGYDYKGAFDLDALPPTILSSNMSNMINSDIFNKLLISLYNNYDKYDFQHLFWMYWHASTSHFYSASVQFGGCIESLQNSYLEKNSNSKIIESTEIWKSFRENNMNLIDELCIDNKEKELLKNKINNINILPQQKQLEKLFELLKIELTELESKTWKQRNIPAHGNKIENNLEYIRGVKILRTLFNRLILKISNASEYYYDYYSLGDEKSYNLRLLEDGIKNG